MIQQQHDKAATAKGVIAALDQREHIQALPAEQGRAEEVQVTIP